MSNGKQLREMLAKTRDQKFRKKSDAQIDGLHGTVEGLKRRWQERPQEWMDNLHRGLANRDMESISAKISAAQTARYLDPEERKKASERTKQTYIDNPDLRNNIRKIAKKRVESGEHAEHMRKHLHTPEKLAALSKRMRTENIREVTTPYGVFESRKLMDESLQQRFPHTDFIHRMSSLPDLYYYTDEGPGQAKQELVYYTPYGKAPNIMWHWEKAMAAGCPEAAKVKNPCNDACKWFNKMKNRNPNQFYKMREAAIEWLKFGIKKYPNRKRGKAAK